jgi:uncharacterized protein YwqG
MRALLDALRHFLGRGPSPRVTPPAPPRPAPPDDTSPVGLRRWLVDVVGLSDARARQVAPLALPALSLRVDATAVDDWPVGTSKLGGAPDVPAGWTWPTFGDLPLMFVAQVNLAALRGHPVARALPDAGMLAFFAAGGWGYEPQDRGSARVFWFPDVTALRRMPLPGALPPHARFEAGRLTVREVVTLPSTYDRAVEALQLTEEEEELYVEVALDALLPGDDEPTKHQLLGHADPVQEEMTVDCQRASSGLTMADEKALPAAQRAALEAGARRWRLLAQFDSDDRVEMMWGDAGLVYFWITEEDLAARRFDGAWMILQCS